MDIITSLKNYGLSEEESKLYLAGIKLGESSLSSLAQEAGLKRTSAYLVAERLEKKGLFGKFKMKNGLRFVATPPSRLEKQARQKLENIKELVPKLNVHYSKLQNKPEIFLFQGKEGYLNIFDDPLQYTGITIRAIGSLQNVRDVITTKYDEEYFIPERLRKGINFKGLYPQKEIVSLGLTPEKNRLEKRELRALPQEYSYNIFKMIYKDTVVQFTSKKELLALKIVSPEIASAEKTSFDLMWKMLRAK